MLWLFDSSLDVTTAIAEYESIVASPRYGEHSKIAGRMSVGDIDALRAATYAMLEGDERVYLVERVAEVEGEDGNSHVEVEGREASALLHGRTVAGTLKYAATAAGAIVSGIMASFTGARALPLTFGNGATLGTARDFQTSWGDAGDTILEVIKESGLGFATRLSGTTIYLDIVEPTDDGELIGEAFGDGVARRFERNIADWCNFAYVLGEGEGDARVQVTVDETDGAARRELYVDARDLQRTIDGVTTPLADYQALLAQRGREKLAEMRAIEFVEAQVSEAKNVGSVVWYDSGRWSVSLMVTGIDIISEGGAVRHIVTLGDTPPSVRAMIKRLT